MKTASVKYPDIKTYERLYQKYLLGDRSEEMLDLAGDLSGKVFLDICCGGGRLTKEALLRKAKKSIMVDSEIEMIPKEYIASGLTETLIMTVEDSIRHLLTMSTKKVDVAMCQQGINYWLTEAKAWKLAMLLSEGGIFIFNTFNRKPSDIPKIKEYTLHTPGKVEEDHFVEISWFVKNDWFDIHHVQICNGEPPHFTKFKWMSESYFRECLEKWFDIELITDNKTSIYRCVKK
jgi:SAM-dependent methyltransferase